jgi:hypothetical protein
VIFGRTSALLLAMVVLLLHRFWGLAGHRLPTATPLGEIGA